MANTTKNSFSESNNHSKVLFQRGAKVLDFELNELQDIARVGIYRGLREGSSSIFTSQIAGSNDDGFKVVGTGASNQVSITGPGYVFLDGIPVQKAATTTLALSAPHATLDRIDVVYLTFNEQEIADPNAMPQLGETSRRIKQVVVIEVLNGTPNVTPVAPTITASSSNQVWEGGTRRYKIAEVYRTANVATVAAEKVTDFRQRLPPKVLSTITQQWPQPAPNGIITTGNWTYSVGDGTSSFGDFNGSDGIRQAINFLNSLGATWSATLKVKNGAYTVTGLTNNIVIPTGCLLRLEGESTAGTVITGSFGLDVEIVGSLEASDIKFIHTTASERILALQLGHGSGSYLRLTRCQFSNTFLYIGGSSSSLADGRDIVVATDCTFIAGTSDCFKFEFNSTNVVSGFRFLNCSFQGAQSQAIFTFTACRPKNVYFVNCRLRNGGVLSTIANATNTSSVFRIVHSVSYATIVNDIHYIDCDVSSALPSTGSSVLLYAYIPDGDSVGLIEVRGGRWIAEGGANTQSPFTVGKNVDRCELSDVTIGWTTTTGLTYGVVPAEAAEAHTAAFSFAAARIRVRNVTVENSVALSNEADFLFFPDSRLDISGLSLKVVTGGGGALPAYRFIVFDGRALNSPAKMDIGKVDIYSDAVRLATSSIGYMVTGRQLATYGSEILFDQCNINQRSNPASDTAKGFIIGDGVEAATTFITFRRCAIAYVGSHGVYTIRSSGALPRVSFQECHIYNCVGQGISFTGNIPRYIAVSNCLIHGCSQEGVYIIINLVSSNGGSFSITNNRIYGNALSAGQIAVVNLGSDGLYGTILGNDCYDETTLTVGRIRCIIPSGNYNVVGIATGTANLVTPISLASSPSNGETMLFNRALWHKV